MNIKPNQIASRVAVLIVTYNSASDIHACLEAEHGSKDIGGVRVFVVDNGSSDGTGDIVAREFPDVRLIRNRENIYYAKACNQGAEAADGDAKYLLLLNPDVCLHESTLKLLAEYLDRNEGVAAVAPKLVWPDGKVQRSVRRSPTYATLWCELLGLSRLFPRHPAFARWRMDLDNVHDAVDVEQPMASCLLIRRAGWDALGGFDERFPMFFNDVDLCYRVREAGWRIVYLPNAVATHRLGGSTRRVMAKMVWFSHLGFLRYLRKHYSSGFGILKWVLVAPVAILAAVVRSMYWLARGRI